MDGLAAFIENIWGVIRSDKELNLPDTKEMVANFRCNEIKDEALEQVKDLFQALSDSCKENICNDFGAKCKEIITKSVDYYEENAH